MNSDGIKRLVMAFAADMEEVMLEEENMAKQPQFDDLSNTAGLLMDLRDAVGELEICDLYDIEASNGDSKRKAVHVANYAMMIYWHAEQRRLAERGGEGRE